MYRQAFLRCWGILLSAAVLTALVSTVAAVTPLAPTRAPRPLAGQSDQTPAETESGRTPPSAPRLSSVPADKADSAGPSAEPEPTPASGTADVVMRPAEAAKPVEKSPGNGPLLPIAAPENAEPVEIEATGYKGVSPGMSTVEEVEKAWGKPKDVRKQGNVLLHLYSVEPFRRIEATFVENKVASLVFRFDKSANTGIVAQQLGLARIQPVLVQNELGENLGQAYPETGVMLAFESGHPPGKVPAKVSHVILEPITAEPFVLRAENNLDTRCDTSIRDLDQALKLQPDNARAHWLRGRALAMLGDYEKAAAAAAEAVRLAPADARYHVTWAEALGNAGRVAEGAAEAQKAMELSESRPHVKARALCLLGDLATAGAKPDYKKALGLHMQAIEQADKLKESPHPAVRVPAKEVLVDAHLGAAHDIAWGPWNKQKEVSVETWLGRASAAAEELAKNDGGGDEVRFRVAKRALAAALGVRNGLNPARWADEAARSGKAMIVATPVPGRKAQVQWELGMALYDALQICQMRSEQDAALKYGEMAADYLEKANRAQGVQGDYLLGRLYFRLGAIRAVQEGNHRAAVTWFDKALPLLNNPSSGEHLADIGRHAETILSMGSSYWEAGQQEKALELTQRGAEVMEQAVEQGKVAASALTLPYTNLAKMNQKLGRTEKARRYEEMAARNQGTRAQ